MLYTSEPVYTATASRLRPLRMPVGALETTAMGRLLSGTASRATGEHKQHQRHRVLTRQGTQQAGLLRKRPSLGRSSTSVHFRDFWPLGFYQLAGLRLAKGQH